MNDSNHTHQDREQAAPSAYRIAVSKIMDELDNERAKARASGQDKHDRWWGEELIKRLATIEHLMSPAKRARRLKRKAWIDRMDIDCFKGRAGVLKESLFRAAKRGSACAVGWYLKDWNKRLAEIEHLQTHAEITALIPPALEDGTTVTHIAVKQNNRDMLEVIADYGHSLDTLDHDGKAPMDYASPELQVYLAELIEQSARGNRKE